MTQNDQPDQDVAVIPVAPTSLQPRNLTEAQELARVLAVSGLVPRDLRGKPADLLVIMMYGMELGLSVNQAMRGIDVIEGRPAMSVELRVAKTRERGHRVGVVCVCGEWPDHPTHGDGPSTTDPGRHQYDADWTDKRCTVKAVRRDTGEAAVVTWTVEDAQRAGLLRPGKGDLEGRLISRSSQGKVLPWEAYTRDMLYNRAAGRACKQIAPEVGYGLYSAEEIEHMPDDEPTRVEVSVGEPVAGPDMDEAAADAARIQSEYEAA